MGKADFFPLRIKRKISHHKHQKHMSDELMEVVALLFISVLHVYSLQIYIEMETLLSGLYFSLEQEYKHLQSYLFMPPLPFSSCQWQVFCFTQGQDAENNFLSPYLFLLCFDFERMFFCTQPAMDFGSTKNILVLFFFF